MTKFNKPPPKKFLLIGLHSCLLQLNCRHDNGDSLPGCTIATISFIFWPDALRTKLLMRMLIYQVLSSFTHHQIKINHWMFKPQVHRWKVAGIDHERHNITQQTTNNYYITRITVQALPFTLQALYMYIAVHFVHRTKELGQNMREMVAKFQVSTPLKKFKMIIIM